MSGYGDGGHLANIKTFFPQKNLFFQNPLYTISGNNTLHEEMAGPRWLKTEKAIFRTNDALFSPWPSIVAHQVNSQDTRMQIPAVFWSQCVYGDRGGGREIAMLGIYWGGVRGSGKLFLFKNPIFCKMKKKCQASSKIQLWHRKRLSGFFFKSLHILLPLNHTGVSSWCLPEGLRETRPWAQFPEVAPRPQLSRSPNKHFCKWLLQSSCLKMSEVSFWLGRINLSLILNTSHGPLNPTRRDSWAQNQE